MIHKPKDSFYANAPICTVSGAIVDVAQPDPDDIRLSDITNALSKICRYAGNVERFYSVAQHSVLVAQHVVRLLARRGTVMETEEFTQLLRAALLHDASEAYTNDVPLPVKVAIGEPFKRLEAGLMDAVAYRFGVDAEYFDHPILKQADWDLYLAETTILTPDVERPDVDRSKVVWNLHFNPLPHERAKVLFENALKEVGVVNE